MFRMARNQCSLCKRFLEKTLIMVFFLPSNFILYLPLYFVWRTIYISPIYGFGGSGRPKVEPAGGGGNRFVFSLHRSLWSGFPLFSRGCMTGCQHVWCKNALNISWSAFFLQNNPNHFPTMSPKVLFHTHSQTRGLFHTILKSNLRPKFQRHPPIQPPTRSAKFLTITHS